MNDKGLVSLSRWTGIQMGSADNFNLLFITSARHNLSDLELEK
jgi:hypothetical protein